MITELTKYEIELTKLRVNTFILIMFFSIFELLFKYLKGGFK